MKTQYIIPFIFGLILLTLANGCTTQALWQNENLEAWKQPATSPNLRLFAAKQPDDILVVYDEYSERSGATHTRAYWLNQNQKRIDERHAPHFVDANNSLGCTAVPVVLASTNQIAFPLPYAVVATNGQFFTLHLNNGTIEPHDLPCYNDHKGKIEKFALTPLATAADVTIVGGFLGYLYLGGLNAGNNPSY
jgi:hypothetical protein